MKKSANVLVLPGDGIGQEVMSQGLRVLIKASEIFEIDLSIEKDLTYSSQQKLKKTNLSYLLK